MGVFKFANENFSIIFQMLDLNYAEVFFIFISFSAGSVLTFRKSICLGFLLLPRLALARGIS